jgi:GntR family transcriptional regulator
MLAATLELKPGDGCFRVERVRTADGRPMALEQVYLPVGLFEGIERIDFADASLFEVLEGRFGVSLGDAQQRVVAVSIEAGEAPLLGVPEGAPGLRFHTVARNRDRVPVYYAISLFRGDRYEVAFNQTRE